jgi:dephospho-CoA kinase
MKVIGLAGWAGCGKSAVAQELSQRPGVNWVNLDSVAWEMYRPRTPTYWRLVARFGEGVLDASGSIDRSQLAALVFSDAKALADLNAITHPAVMKHLRKVVSEEEARGTALLLVEGALLGSSSYVDRALFDAILWLEASSRTREKRLRLAGRKHHAEREHPEPDRVAVIRVNAEGPLSQVVSRVQGVIAAL